MHEAEKLSALRKAIADMVFIINADGRYTEFTPAERLKPLVPPELFIGRRVSDVLPTAVGELAMEALKAALRTQELQVINYELWEGDALRGYECRIAAAGPSEVLALVRETLPASLYEQNGVRDVESLEARAASALLRGNAYSLSFRELLVLDLVVEGLADKEIAGRLACSRFTVNKHVTSILAKMGARSRTEAAVRAIRQGVIPVLD